MKKFISIFMILALCLSLCSCGPETDPEPVDPGTDPSGDSKKLDEQLLADFYNQVAGVWVCHYKETDGYTFMAFSESEDKICYTAGIPETEFIFGGPISYIEKDGTKYNLTVAVPEVPSTEEYSGHEAYELDVQVDTASLASYTLFANDHAKNGDVQAFSYYWEHLPTVDWGALRAGNEPMTEFNEELASKLWHQLSGIWLIDEVKDDLFFTTFDYRDGNYYVMQGIPASGYGISGKLVEIVQNGDQYDMIIYVPAVEENEEYSGHPEFYADLILRVKPNDKIELTLFAGDGDVPQWKLAGTDWESFNWDQVYGIDLASAWNQLTGCWVGKNTNGDPRFVNFMTHTNGDRYIDIGIPFSGGSTAGKVLEFEDRPVDSTWWFRIFVESMNKSIYIMVDYSGIGSKKIRVTNFFQGDDGKVVNFEYKCEDVQHLTVEMLD